MSLQLVENAVIRILKEQLKWTLSFVGVRLLTVPVLQLSGLRDCDGNGYCLEQIRDGYLKPKATACKCKLIECENCSDGVPQWIIDYREGYCVSCYAAFYESTEEFDNRRTKLNCLLCGLRFDRKYHRVDHKNSNHVWVRELYHERCYYERRIEEMGNNLDEHCDCKNNLNCEH